VVLLNFWATWCPPCRQEIPHFEALHGSFESEGLSVVGLSLDQEGEKVVRGFCEKQGITYPVAVVGREVVDAFAKLEGIPVVSSGGGSPSPGDGSVRAIPTTFVIDRKGRVYRKHVGYREEKHLAPEIRELLAEG